MAIKDVDGEKHSQFSGGFYTWVGNGAVEFQQELQGPVRLSQSFRVDGRRSGS